MRAVVFCPAKLNLFLAITGRRADGFHELVSVAAPLAFGDRLTVETRDNADAGVSAGRARFTLVCDDPGLAVDGTNLVLRAAEAFVEASGWRGGADFNLEKRIPAGAGLGGGSSDATGVLEALNEAAGRPLSAARLAEVAAGLGSDCALFLAEAPVVMRGRGEFVEKLAEAGAARLRGRRVLVFKPEFGIATVWAYRRMAAGAPGSYLAKDLAEARLAEWLAETPRPAEELLFNNMEAVAFERYVALPVMLGRLQEEFGLAARMSGSGSACYALLPEEMPAARVASVVARIREEWGARVFVTETRLA